MPAGLTEADIENLAIDWFRSLGYECGAGINLAIQDAVAMANILARPLTVGRLSSRDLETVQRRREFPTRVTQAFQVFIQNHVLTRVLSTRHTLAPPWPLRLLNHIPFLPARLIGLGIRPEHIQTPDVFGA